MQSHTKIKTKFYIYFIFLVFLLVIFKVTKSSYYMFIAQSNKEIHSILPFVLAQYIGCCQDGEIGSCWMSTASNCNGVYQDWYSTKLCCGNGLCQSSCSTTSTTSTSTTTTIPLTTCRCSEWEAVGCGEYPCNSNERRYVCKSGNCNNRCVSDSSCVSYCVWESTDVCCDPPYSGKTLQKNSCDNTQTRCAGSCSSECACSPWNTDGQGDCPPGYVEKTRECNPSGCDDEKVCELVLPTTTTISSSTISSTTTLQPALSLQLSVSKSKCKEGDNQQIISTVTANGNPISNAIVNITIKDSKQTTKYTDYCYTKSNGQCTVSYQIHSELGNWSVIGTAAKAGFLPANATASFDVIAGCTNDNDCMTYEYCRLSDNTCVDLRPQARDCNYFDYCFSGNDPGTGQPCQWNVNCYSVNIPQADMWLLCNDASYFNHSLTINCG